MARKKLGRPAKLHPNFQKKSKPKGRVVNGFQLPFPKVPTAENDPTASLFDKAPLIAFESAKEAWLKGESVNSISDNLGIPMWRLNAWIYGRPIVDPDGNKIANSENWTQEREENHQRRLKLLYKNDKERFERVLSKTIDTIEQSVDKIFNSNITLSASEVKNLSTVAKDLHQMTQLEGGKPTKIVENMTVTRETLVKKLKEIDPFISYDEEDNDGAGTKPTIQ